MLNYSLCTRNTFLYKVDFLSCFYDLLLYFLHQGLFKGIFRYSGIKKNKPSDGCFGPVCFAGTCVGVHLPPSIRDPSVLQTHCQKQFSLMTSACPRQPGVSLGVSMQFGCVFDSDPLVSETRGETWVAKINTVLLPRARCTCGGGGTAIWLVCCHGYFTNSLIDLYN